MFIVGLGVFGEPPVFHSNNAAFTNNKRISLNAAIPFGFWLGLLISKNLQGPLFIFVTFEKLNWNTVTEETLENSVSVDFEVERSRSNFKSVFRLWIELRQKHRRHR